MNKNEFILGLVALAILIAGYAAAIYLESSNAIL